VGGFLHFIVEPGLLSSGPVRTAVLVGTVVAVTSGVVGVLTVIRGQSFAGHSLADVATTGGAGAFLAGVSQFWGFLIAGIAGAAIMELIDVQRRRGRDVATGVVLGAALGAAALFLYLGTLTSSTTGASFTIGPAATALRITKRPGRAMAAAALTGTAATWLGILLAYDSYYWTPGGRGWPVSFFVVAIVVLGYLLTHARLPGRGRAAHGQTARSQENQEAPACSPA
jgi:ABC-type Mn2+/Zn2+ transport system permease subunit